MGIRNLKLCYIGNPASIHLQRMVDHCRKYGHDVFIITSKVNEALDVNQLRPRFGLPVPPAYRESPFRNAFSPLSLAQIRNIIDREHPDIIQAYYATNYGFLASLIKRHPLIVTLYGSDLFVNPKSKFLRLFVKHAINSADIVHCLFPLSLAADSLSSIGTEIEKVRSILFGVDISSFTTLDYDVEFAKEIGLTDFQPLVVNVRGLASVYDPATFFKAISLVSREFGNVKFLVLHRPGQREHGEQLAKKFGVYDSVILKEWISQGILPKLYSVANIYVSTSLSDGASNSLLEAMACGVPPVVSDIPANRPWVENGNNGLLFPTGDFESLASAIMQILRNYALHDQFGERSRQIIYEKANKEVEAEKLEKLYNEILGNRRTLL